MKRNINIKKFKQKFLQIINFPKDAKMKTKSLILGSHILTMLPLTSSAGVLKEYI